MPTTAGQIRIVTAVMLGSLVLATALAGENWTQWGGSNRDFRVSAEGLADQWPDGGPRRIWSRPLGEGYSGVLAADGVLFATYRDKGREAIVSIDAASGTTIWEHRYPATYHESQSTQFGSGPNATPLLAGEYLISVGFTSIVQCVRKSTGTPVWSHKLVPEFDATPVHFGYSSSPLLYRDLVIVLTGGKYGAIGFDLRTGKPRWRAPSMEIGYASPIVIDVDGEDQLVFMTPTGVVGIALKDGTQRWSVHHENQFQTNCVGPWWNDDNTLFVSSQGNVGSRTLRLTRKKGATVVQEIGRDLQMRMFHNSAVREANVIYGGSHDYLVAYDVLASRMLWREDGFVEANVVRAGNKMIVLDEQGTLALVTMTPQGMSVHSRTKLLERPAWTAPSVVGTRLYARDNKQLVALELGRPESGQADPP